jgi:hypothetical protein
MPQFLIPSERSSINGSSLVHSYCWLNIQLIGDITQKLPEHSTHELTSVLNERWIGSVQHALRAQRSMAWRIMSTTIAVTKEASTLINVLTFERVRISKSSSSFCVAIRKASSPGSTAGFRPALSPPRISAHLVIYSQRRDLHRWRRCWSIPIWLLTFRGSQHSPR